jgi:hypothetical protein
MTDLRTTWLTKVKFRLITIISSWVTVAVVGLAGLWRYENRPGSIEAPPPEWPAASHIARNPTGNTLVMFAHPHCPCSEASVSELSRIMAAINAPIARVEFIRPMGVSNAWMDTSLRHSAAEIPGVSVIEDRDGIEAKRFKADTSGLVALYSAAGKLLFYDGVTSARAHAGDNIGETAIISLIKTGWSNTKHTPVYGCPLFDVMATTCTVCRK